MLGLGLGLAALPATRSHRRSSTPQADADRKVTGGVTAKGWTGKEDAGNKQGLTVKDSKLADEGKGLRLATGPAGLYWNPANVAKGDYTVSATFNEAEQTYNHPHPFGVFIGGSDLETATHRPVLRRLSQRQLHHPHVQRRQARRRRRTSAATRR